MEEASTAGAKSEHPSAAGELVSTVKQQALINHHQLCSHMHWWQLHMLIHS